MKKLIVRIIDFYRNTLALLKIKSCRFYPTCSVYTKEAILRHGALKGVVMGMRRIIKCNQFNKGGFDPVP